MPDTMPDPAKSQRLTGAAIATALAASTILYGVLQLLAPLHDQIGHTWHPPDAMLIDIVAHA